MLFEKKKTETAEVIAHPGTSEDALKALARNIQLWSDAGVLLPLQSDQVGRGRHRLFGLGEVALAAVAHTLHQLGVSSVEHIDAVLSPLRLDLISNPRSAAIVQALYLKTDPDYERWPLDVQLVPVRFFDGGNHETSSPAHYVMQTDPETFARASVPGVIRLRLSKACEALRNSIVASQVLYAAEIKTVGNRFVATLPDWPEVVSQKAATEEEALADATTKVEQAITARAKDGDPLPTPLSKAAGHYVTVTGLPLLRAALAELAALVDERLPKWEKR